MMSSLLVQFDERRSSNQTIFLDMCECDQPKITFENLN